MFETVVQLLFLVTQSISLSYTFYTIAKTDCRFALWLIPSICIYCGFHFIPTDYAYLLRCCVLLHFIWLLLIIFRLLDPLIELIGKVDEDEKYIRMPPDMRFFVHCQSHVQVYFVYIYRVYEVGWGLSGLLILFNYIWIIYFNHKIKSFSRKDEEYEEKEGNGVEKEETEKIFNHYPNLPPELQIMVIDQMQSKDRIRFSKCSKICNKQAKLSRNYIHELEFLSIEGYTCISVIHGFNDKKKAIGYKLFFEKKGDYKYAICKSLGGKRVWLVNLERVTDLDLYARQYFRRKLMHLHQHKIKKLTIKTPIGFGNRNLKGLEKLSIVCNTDVQQFLSKTGRKLRSIIIPNKNLENYEQIYHVQQLDSSATQLTNEQFLRLSASEVRINIGTLAEKDIFNFIQSWKNGRIGKKIKRYEWIINNSSFNVAVVFNLCGGEYDGSRSKIHVIKHDEKEGCLAGLSYYEFSMEFRTLSFMVHFTGNRE